VVRRSGLLQDELTDSPPPLGLPLSRRFCRMLDGNLTLESQPGEGSFGVTFVQKVDCRLTLRSTSSSFISCVALSNSTA